MDDPKQVRNMFYSLYARQHKKGDTGATGWDNAQHFSEWWKLQPRICQWCFIDLETDRGLGSYSMQTASPDRLLSLDYEGDNVVMACLMCQRAKHKATPEEFREYCNVVFGGAALPAHPPRKHARSWASAVLHSIRESNDIVAADVEKMFADQNGCCPPELGGIPMHICHSKTCPFLPSLDRHGLPCQTVGPYAARSHSCASTWLTARGVNLSKSDNAYKTVGMSNTRWREALRLRLANRLDIAEGRSASAQELTAAQFQNVISHIDGTRRALETLMT
jgi:hypothetical protein